MTAARSPVFVGIDEYLAREAASPIKHEYLGGVIHAMAGGSNDHAALAANVIVALGSRLRGTPCRPYSSDTKVRIELPDQTRFYYPDAMVVREPNAGREQFQERPIVVVQVLSDGTRRTDLGEKRDAYLTISSLKVLVFVEPARASLLVYRRRPEGGFAAEVLDQLGETLALPELGIDVPLAEIYDGLALT